jgi:hypothetical protein
MIPKESASVGMINKHVNNIEDQQVYPVFRSGVKPGSAITYSHGNLRFSREDKGWVFVLTKNSVCTGINPIDFNFEIGVWSKILEYHLFFKKIQEEPDPIWYLWLSMIE